MFKPELKDTIWEDAPEVVFEITGENYRDLNFWGNHLGSVHYADIEKELADIINNEIMNVVWEPITISELEVVMSDKLKLTNIDILNFRLDLKEVSWDQKGLVDTKDCIYGWVHYRHEKKIKTFRFKIDLKGEFSKC